MTPLVVGVTSHRNIPAREIEPIRQRVREFFAQLRHDFPELPLVVLSALAEGGDQLVAQEALAQGARLMAPLPLPREMYVDDFADPAVRASFDTLCSQAEIVLLPKLMNQPSLAIGAQGMPRDRQYAKAGVYIASHCHILLAIWDGKASGRLGGTAQIVDYHLTGALPGLIDRRRDTRHVLGGGDESLLYHIVCSRAHPDGAPAEGLLPLQAGWRSADTLATQVSLPAEFHLMFARMAEFNAERDNYATQIEAAPHGVPSNATLTIDQTFHAADWLAMHFQKRVLLAMRLTYTLAALMGIAFTFYAHLPAQDYLIYLFLLLFASGGAVAVLARRRGWHRKYLDYRALAEGLRIQSYWRRAGISANADHEFAHDNFLQKQNIELGWIRNVMRAASLYPSIQPEQATPAALADVIAEWVGESGKSGQLHYYECKIVERTGLHHVTETVGRISLWGGVAISVFLAAFALVLAPDTKIFLVMIMAVLSIVAAVREAYSYRKADKELIRQYRFMQRIFAGARAALDRTQDPIQQREILLSLGDAALTEHAEWTLMQRERQVEHSKL
ncbi:hypothetical protein EAH75_00750 [Rhodanobacter glycinis]|uniref:SMODS and SLOG-associating 2TM effector domain-containing protein n=1 Tax=Rhodanobacter glycinis TaxID=582702 RepID=A0A502FKM0_9GAMM|nr:hypothetical protein [Rhodanobacter glycinis]TPG08190.1 hypothetical protein EAH88_11095 [Rhodanobacter glycinis]TPG50067.1 hypothetical protein EAH75_00750 [Rhodanobacter glycinis]